MINKTGVYKITNTVNGRIYYGSASNGLKKRGYLFDVKPPSINNGK